MIISLALIFITGIFLGILSEKIKFPKIIFYILIGIVFGPYCLNLLDESLLNISKTLRTIALVIILTRAGLTLNFAELKKIGRPAFFMCFVPAVFEIIGAVLLAPYLLKISLTESLLLGSVLAAVSPAIIVPKMIKLKESGYGKTNNVPSLILASASVDDVIVIVLFYLFLGLNQNQTVNWQEVAFFPLSIINGVLIGILLGLILNYIFKKIKVDSLYKILLILAVSFLLIFLE